MRAFERLLRFSMRFSPFDICDIGIFPELWQLVQQCRYFVFSPVTEDSFAFGAEVSSFTKTTIARIPEEDDVMETETGSAEGNSSDSVLESENEAGSCLLL
jgi:hypothetical protein